MEDKKTFLTETQAEVLRLRREGLTQAKIAERFGTTRSNICSLEKRAKENIEKAERTLNLARKIRAPVTVTIGKDEDILDSAKNIFRKADKANIHVSLDTPGLISKIEQEAEGKLKGRRATEEIQLSLTPEGEVLVL